MDIQYDDFIRTTEERHVKSSTKKYLTDSWNKEISIKASMRVGTVCLVKHILQRLN